MKKKLSRKRRLDSNDDPIADTVANFGEVYGPGWRLPWQIKNVNCENNSFSIFTKTFPTTPVCVIPPQSVSFTEVSATFQTRLLVSRLNENVPESKSQH